MPCFDDRSLYFLKFPYISPQGKICLFLSRVVHHLKKHAHKNTMILESTWTFQRRLNTPQWFSYLILSCKRAFLWLQSVIRELNRWAGSCSIFTFTTRWQHCSWELYLFHLPLYNLLCTRLLPRTAGGTTHTLTVKGLEGVITGTLVSDGEVKS